MFSISKNKEICPICGGDSSFYCKIGKYHYFNCKDCDFIFIDTLVLDDIDNGKALIEYNENYWKAELKSSKHRSYDDSVGRLTELIYYARLTLNIIVDIGTGPGYLLDFVDNNMQKLSKNFYGIEKYPPLEKYRTKNNNYFIGGIDEFGKKIDAGICIEVIEHLTPKMFDVFLNDLSKKANKNSIFLFNTGMSHMVKKGHNDYLDPLIRGHIVSWSIKSIKILCEKYNFTFREIRGKNFAFILEYNLDDIKEEDITNRVWSPIKENLELLHSENLGCLLKTFGRASIREFL